MDLVDAEKHEESTVEEVSEPSASVAGTDGTSPLSWSRWNPDRWIITTLGLSVVYFLIVSRIGWMHTFGRMHGFRQAQTAISSYYFFQNKNFWDYQTPAVGAPWLIPMEFPAYQGIVAWIERIFHTPLIQTGRFVSEFFFGLTLLSLWGILKELNLPTRQRFIFLVLMLVSPVYLFWSRAFLVESTALCFCALLLYYTLRFLNSGSPFALVGAILCGTIGALVKSTTLPPFLFVVAAVGVLRFWQSRAAFASETDKQGTIRRARTAYRVAFLIFVIILPISAGLKWSSHADKIKVHNVVGNRLTSAALRDWFGGLGSELVGMMTGNLLEKTSKSDAHISQFSFPETVRILQERILPDSIGSETFLFLLLVPLLWLPSTRIRILICLGAWFISFLLFTRVHLVHNYYQYANSIFLVAAVGWGVVGLLNSPIRAWNRLGGLMFYGVICFSLLRYTTTLLPEQQQENDDILAVSSAVRAATTPDMVVVGLGLDWSPELPFYAKRRGLMWPPWMSHDLNDPEWNQAIENIGVDNIGAVVTCNDSGKDKDFVAELLRRLRLSSVSVYKGGNCSVYTRGR